MTPLPNISQHLHIAQGFCHPDWDAIWEIVERQVPQPEWSDAWDEATRRWLDRLRDTLGEDYHLHETPNFHFLSAAPPRIVKDLRGMSEDALKQIAANLQGAMSGERIGKYIVLMFARIEDYYRYISYFYPDGEHAGSGGLCLSGEGNVHFAFPAADFFGYRTVLVHELTHCCLAHHPIPSWLNEALAMRMEEAICGTATFHLDHEIHEKHLAHWNAETIQQFWSGESWHIPGDSSELSYNLAQILWRNIVSDLAATRPQILELILQAHHDDAGEAAYQNIFALSLGDLVTDFLGEGPWLPDPAKWPARE